MELSISGRGEHGLRYIVSAARRESLFEPFCRNAHPYRRVRQAPRWTFFRSTMEARQQRGITLGLGVPGLEILNPLVYGIEFTL